MDNGWARVGQYARDRRKQLGLTQEQIKAGGGPSTALVRQVEKGTYNAQMQAGVQRAYEEKLQWHWGSIERIRQGGEPVPVGPEGTFVSRDGLAEILQDQHPGVDTSRSPSFLHLLVRWVDVTAQRETVLKATADMFGESVEEAEARLEGALEALGGAAEARAERNAVFHGSAAHGKATYVPVIADETILGSGSGPVYPPTGPGWESSVFWVDDDEDAQIPVDDLLGPPPIPEDLAADDPGEPTKAQQQDKRDRDDNAGR